MRNLWITGAAALMLAACGRESGDEAETLPAAPAEAPAEETAGGGDAAAGQDAEAVEAELRAQFEKIAADNLAASTAFLEENAGAEGVVATESGLQYKVLTEGPEGGASPIASDLVTVHYVGTLRSGAEFDSSRARGEPASFPLNRVIRGWTEGLQLMSEGDTFRFFLPPDLAYGASGSGPLIGPNEALIFDVELIKVQNPERNLEKANDFLAENARKEGVQTTESGLQYLVLSEGAGDGKSPSASDTVEVHYQGTLLDGSEFDSSYKRGETIEFPLNRVIPGWTEGVQLMSEGDKYRFFIPPALGYGERGTPGGPIGPNEALIFEVELVAVK